MSWTTVINLDGAREGRTPKFKWTTSKHSGEAHMQRVTYNGGLSVWVHGPSINKDGEIAYIERSEIVPLDALPYSVLKKLEEATYTLIADAQAGLAPLNRAIIPKVPSQ